MYRNQASLHIKGKYIQEPSQFAHQRKIYRNQASLHIKGKHIQEQSQFAHQGKVYTGTKPDQKNGVFIGNDQEPFDKFCILFFKIPCVY